MFLHGNVFIHKIQFFEFTIILTMYCHSIATNNIGRIITLQWNRTFSFNEHYVFIRSNSTKRADIDKVIQRLSLLHSEVRLTITFAHRERPQRRTISLSKIAKCLTRILLVPVSAKPILTRFAEGTCTDCSTLAAEVITRRCSSPFITTDYLNYFLLTLELPSIYYD